MRRNSGASTENLIAPSGRGAQVDAGAASTAGSQSVRIPVSGMTCAACSSRVQRALEKQPGVADANVNLMMKTATVHFDPAVVDAFMTLVDDLDPLLFDGHAGQETFV